MRKIDEAYEFIREYIKSNDSSPTIREICDGINVKSTSTVTYYLRKLEELHKITRTNLKTRGFKLVETSPRKIDVEGILNLPFIDELHPQHPLISEENIAGHYVVNADLFKGYNMFIVPMRDDSMRKNAGIKQGDLLVISHQQATNNGELVVALIKNQYFIRRVYREFDLIRLMADEGYPYDEVYAKQVVILGKVVGLIRPKV